MNTHTQRGYVYILSNESMPGLLKIGYTKNDPMRRAIELYSTGVPTPFRVEFAMICDSAYDVEQEFHESFEERRVSCREFFKLSIEEAIIGLFRMSGMDMEARQADCVLDEGDHNRYSAMAEVHPFTLMMLLEEINLNEWRVLAKRHDRRNKARLERIRK